jgi:hypothetical protein
MILHLVRRILLIFGGYALATIASGIFVGLAFYAAEGDGSMNVIGIMALAIFMIGIYAALPALFFVVIGESLRLRRPLYWIAAACLIGMALPVVVLLARWYILVGLGFGPVAGLIYWRIAGRNAGFQLPVTA